MRDSTGSHAPARRTPPAAPGDFTLRIPINRPLQVLKSGHIGRGLISLGAAIALLYYGRPFLVTVCAAVIINFILVVSSIGTLAQDSARTVQYHSQDIIPIRAKLKYTTLIELPTTEKIMEAATGDKDFWIVDVVGNFCFVHPAKQGISSNLNLITDKGNIYSFTLQDISGSPATGPDLKVIVEPADRSAIIAASGPPQFVPAAQLEQSRQQLAALQSHVEQAVDEYKSAYPTQLKFDYSYKANEAPFDIQSIYHDEKFTYIKTNAPEKFSVYEMKDGKPNLVTYDLREGTYIIPKIMDSGYVELGKKRMEFTRKG